MREPSLYCSLGMLPIVPAELFFSGDFKQRYRLDLDPPCAQVRARCQAGCLHSNSRILPGFQ